MLKVIVPLSSVEECEPLISLGADELYCGVNKAHSAVTLNRREMDTANLGSLSELRDAAKRSREGGVPLFVTLNKIYYTKDEFIQVVDLLDSLADTDVSGIIVSDMSLIRHVFSRGYDKVFKVHLSSVACVFNAHALSFYRQFNFSRVILPRHLSLKQIGLIRGKHADIEMEVFVLNWRCANIDGLCNTQHDLKACSGGCPEGITSNQCCLGYDIDVLNESGITKDTQDRILMQVKERFADVEGKSSRACGACFLRELEDMGVHHVKVVGRLLPRGQKIKSLQFLKSCLQLPDAEEANLNYALNVKRLYRSCFGVHCGQNCYFPLNKDE